MVFALKNRLLVSPITILFILRSYIDNDSVFRGISTVLASLAEKLVTKDYSMDEYAERYAIVADNLWKSIFHPKRSRLRGHTHCIV